MIRFAGDYADAARGALELEKLLGAGTVHLAGKSPKHGLVQVLMARVATSGLRHGFAPHGAAFGVPLEMWIGDADEGEAIVLAAVLAKLAGERVAVRCGPEKHLLFFAEPR